MLKLNQVFVGDAEVAELWRDAPAVQHVYWIQATRSKRYICNRFNLLEMFVIIYKGRQRLDYIIKNGAEIYNLW